MKIKRIVLSLFIIFFIVQIFFSNFSKIFATEDERGSRIYNVTNVTEDENTLTANLSEGEMEVNKSVSYNDDEESFTVSLLAQGAKYTAKLNENSVYNIVLVVDNSRIYVL